MKNQNKFKSFIFFILVLLVWLFLVAFLTGCSTQKKIDWRLKQSNRHYEKAISLGYSPLISYSEINSNLEVKLKQNFVTSLPSVIINKLEESKDEIGLIREGLAANVITSYIEKEVLKNIDLDTTIILFNDDGDSLGSVHIKIDSLGLQLKSKVANKETIYVKQNLYDILGLNSWWKIALLWLFIIIIVLLFVIRSFK